MVKNLIEGGASDIIQLGWEEGGKKISGQPIEYNVYWKKTLIDLFTINRVPTSLVIQNSMYVPGYFQVKAMKSQVNLT